MANSNDGFFSSGGSLRSDSLQSSGYDAWRKSREQAQQQTTSVANQAASATASAITDAALYTISSRLNVGNTGYDSGTSDMVNEAVTAALQKIGSAASSSSSTPTWGTYQNSLIAASKAAQSTRAETPAAQPQPEASIPEEIPPVGDLDPVPSTPVKDPGKADKTEAKEERREEQDERKAAVRDAKSRYPGSSAS